MARTPQSADQLEAMASELFRASETLKEVASMIRDNGLPHSLIHGTTVKTRYIPEVLDWIDKAKAETQSQVRAYLADIPSKAELHKQRNETRKLAAAKKPWKKKATKKKAT